MIQRRRSSLRALIVGLALATGASGATGCLVTSGPSRGRSHHGAHGSDHHCHERGGKHRKRVCHAHPHSRDHH